MLLILVFFLQGVTSSLGEIRRDLILVQAVVRNGFSAPEELYPSDPNDPSSWEEGLGQLTLLGKKQMYALGEILRSRYKNLLTSNPQEIYAQSSELPKCVNSALSLLASLDSPTEAWQFLEGFNWQPKPVFYWPHKDDMLLGPIHKCPAILKEIQKSIESVGNRTILDMYKQQFRFWTLNSGTVVNHWNHAAALYRILHAEYLEKHKVPSWAWKYWKELRCLNDFAYKINFSNKEVLKVFGGPLIWNMMENIIDKIAKRIDIIKFVLYSGQSIHVAGLLATLENFNDAEPPFGASVLVELYEETSTDDNVQNFSVRLLYLNETVPEISLDPPRTLIYPGCGEFCPLAHIHKYSRRWNNNSKWERDCKGSPDLKKIQEQLIHVVKLGVQPMSGEIQW